MDESLAGGRVFLEQLDPFLGGPRGQSEMSQDDCDPGRDEDWDGEPYQLDQRH